MGGVCGVRLTRFGGLGAPLRGLVGGAWILVGGMLVWGPVRGWLVCWTSRYGWLTGLEVVGLGVGSLGGLFVLWGVVWAVGRWGYLILCFGLGCVRVERWGVLVVGFGAGFGMQGFVVGGVCLAGGGGGIGVW